LIEKDPAVTFEVWEKGVEYLHQAHNVDLGARKYRLPCQINM
jgi:hypothetical protein